MTHAQMDRAPDKIGFYWDSKKDEPAEVVWVDYFAFLTVITASVSGDPCDNAYLFDRNLSATFAKIIDATTPS